MAVVHTLFINSEQVSNRCVNCFVPGTDAYAHERSVSVESIRLHPMTFRVHLVTVVKLNRFDVC